MTVERQIDQEVSPGIQERLLPGWKLFLAGPTSLMAFAFANKGLIDKESQQIEQRMMDIMEEYYSIHSSLVNLVGRENIIVIKSKFTVGKNLPVGVEFKSIDLPKELDFGSVETVYLQEFFRSWPRDAHTVLEGTVLANPEAWNIQNNKVEISGLGEGGKVLTKRRTALVTPDIWKSSKNEIQNLRRKGFKVGCLPFVDPSKQKYDFKEVHIDGHASLIEDKEGKLALVVAESYSRQGKGTRKLIRQAAETIEADVVEVYDSALPPLSFNFIQFEDGSILMTGSGWRDLEVTLRQLVGYDKVFTTEVALQYIPTRTCGGIRCLTNVIPPL